jgi:hypothetical protein
MYDCNPIRQDAKINGRGEGICDLSAVIKVEVKPKKTATKLARDGSRPRHARLRWRVRQHARS